MAKTKATTKRSRTSKETEKPGDKEVKVCRRRSNDRRESDETSPEVEGEPAETAALTEQAETETETETETDTGELESEGQEAAPPERRKVQRRRQIDPTTCERDYTNDEIEFMHALDAYKRSSGRMFPTCSEILEVVRSIGYEKIERIEAALLSGELELSDVESTVGEASDLSIESEAPSPTEV